MSKKNGTTYCAALALITVAIAVCYGAVIVGDIGPLLPIGTMAPVTSSFLGFLVALRHLCRRRNVSRTRTSRDLENDIRLKHTLGPRSQANGLWKRVYMWQAYRFRFVRGSLSTLFLIAPLSR